MRITKAELNKKITILEKEHKQEKERLLGGFNTATAEATAYKERYKSIIVAYDSLKAGIEMERIFWIAIAATFAVAGIVYF